MPFLTNTITALDYNRTRFSRFQANPWQVSNKDLKSTIFRKKTRQDQYIIQLPFVFLSSFSFPFAFRFVRFFILWGCLATGYHFELPFNVAFPVEKWLQKNDANRGWKSRVTTEANSKHLAKPTKHGRKNS